MNKLFVVSCFVGLVAACSSSSGSDSAASSGSSDVALHGETPVLPGFSYDTGLQPASGPAQMSLKLLATGSLVSDAVATKSGGKLVGKAGAGAFKLDMHVKLEGHLKVDAGTVKYDGDLPGVKNVDIPIAGTSAFDGFLLDGDPAKVNADVPETKLPDIPLGSVPGHLSLTVASGTHITSTYKGTCLTVKGGQATLAGATTTSGTIVLKPTIVLEVPLFSKSIDLPTVTVNVPATNGELDSAPAKADGADDATQGTCAPAGSSSGSGTSSGGSSSGGSSSGGSSSGGSSSGGTDGGTDGDAGSVATATVLLDAVQLNVDGIDLWAPGPMDSSEYDVFIKVSGPGVPAGSDIAITAYMTGTMCGQKPNGSIYFRPSGDIQYAPKFSYSGGEPVPFACGLTVSSLPTMVGASFSGNFVGALYGLNDESKTHSLDIHFDVPRGQPCASTADCTAGMTCVDGQCR